MTDERVVIVGSPRGPDDLEHARRLREVGEQRVAKPALSAVEPLVDCCGAVNRGPVVVANEREPGRLLANGDM